MTSATTSRRILVVRNDKLGDFMLAWPALAYLKQAQPNNHVSVLVPSYTAPLARACPWVDEVILDPGVTGERDAQRRLLKEIRAGRFDAMLTLFSTPRTGWLGFRARIPLRLAPATKWAQIFYNRRIVQRRSRSQKPEYRYNLELAQALLKALDQTPAGSFNLPAPPYWPLPSGIRQTQRQRLSGELDIEVERPWIFLHAGSGGSAVNLSRERYAELANRLTAGCAEIRPIWLLTAGPGEEDSAANLLQTLRASGLDAYLVPPRPGLEAFALTLAAADLFIAGSTGPLHIAGCLDIPTVGFYPAKRSSTPLRWETCNRADHCLAFSPAQGSATDMQQIDLNRAAADIAAWWRSLLKTESSTSNQRDTP